MNEIVKVSDMMTTKLVTLSPDDGLDKVTKMFEQYKYDGFPVVNPEGVLLGLVTAYDMVSQSYATHLPALLNILEDISKEKADETNLKHHFEGLKDVKVRDIMNEDPLVVGPEVKVEDIAKEFIQHHRVNPIPVVDANKKLLGAVSRFDIIRFFDEAYFNQMLTDSGHGGILQRLERLGDK